MQKPLAAHRRVSITSVVVSFCAFVLVLLVGLSLTIIKPIYLLSLKSTGGVRSSSLATELRFGVWGVCATGAANAPTAFENNGQCFGPKLGYTVPDGILDLLDARGLSQDIAHIILKGLLSVLILHIVTAGLSLTTLFFSLFLGSHGMAIAALFFSIVTALVGTVIFGIDLGLVLTARHAVSQLQDFRFVVNFGPGVWMGLASMLLTWIAVALLSARACYCCGVRRAGRVGHSHSPSGSSHHHHHHHQSPPTSKY